MTVFIIPSVPCLIFTNFLTTNNEEWTKKVSRMKLKTGKSLPRFCIIIRMNTHLKSFANHT